MHESSTPTPSFKKFVLQQSVAYMYCSAQIFLIKSHVITTSDSISQTVHEFSLQGKLNTFENKDEEMLSSSMILAVIIFMRASILDFF